MEDTVQSLPLSSDLLSSEGLDYLAILEFRATQPTNSKLSKLAEVGSPPNQSQWEGTISQLCNGESSPPYFQIEPAEFETIYCHAKVHVIIAYRYKRRGIFRRRLSHALTKSLLKCLAKIYSEQAAEARRDALLTQAEIAIVQKALNPEVNHAQEVPEPYEVILNYLTKEIGFSHGAIWELHDDESLTLEAVASVPIQFYQNTCISKGQGIISEALHPSAGRVTTRQITSSDQLVNKSLFSILKGKTAYIIRLGNSKAPIGVALLASDNPNHKKALADETSTFDAILASQIRARRQQRTLKMFDAIKSLIAGASRDPVAIGDQICQSLLSILQCQGVSLFWRQDSQQGNSEHRLLSSKHRADTSPSNALSEFRNGRIIAYPVSQKTPEGAVAFSRKSSICNQMSSDRLYSEIYREVNDASIDSFLAVPVTDPNQTCLGVLRCLGRLTLLHGEQRNYIFDREDQKLLEMAARIVGPILLQAETSRDLVMLNEDLQVEEETREHEMRGPLLVIDHYSSFVTKHLEDPGVKSKPRKLRAIQNAARLCSTLLTSTQLPSKSSINREQVNIRRMVKELEGILTYMIISRSPSTVTETDDGEVETQFFPYMSVSVTGDCNPAHTDKQLFNRALFNVGSNAVKYAKPGMNGRLLIRLSQDVLNNQAVIQFQDAGIGIPEDEKSKLFLGRFRGRLTKGRPGKGIGLKIAKDLMLQLSGSLECIPPDSTFATAFEFRLPTS